MNKQDDRILRQLTGLTGYERTRALAWHAALPPALMIATIRAGTRIGDQLKAAHPDLPRGIISDAALILAVRDAGWDTVCGKGYRVAGPKQYDDFSHLRKARAAALIGGGEDQVLRKQVLAFWGEVTQLRDEGMSWQTIAAYLAKHRRIEVSAEFVDHLWQEVAAS